MRNFAEFTRKHLCLNLFFDKVKLCRFSASLKTRLWRRCFPVNFAKFVRTPLLQNTTRRLFLIIAVSTFNYFRKKARSEMFNWVENRLQAKGLKHWAHSCSQSLTQAEKILSRKVCVILFLKTRKVFMQKQPPNRFLKKGVMKNFVEVTRKHKRGSLFLIKLNSVYLQLL